jgi:hypothetical protein
MTTNVKFRIVAVIVVFTLLLGVYTATLWRHQQAPFNNFFIYYTAADFVRSNESIHIYDAIDPGTNPEIIFADSNTVWAQRMISFGISRTSLYLYPPTLADLMVPLTLLSPSAALIVWNVLGVLMILGLSVALTKVLDVKFFGSTFLVAAAVLLFRPTLNTIHWGQVTILLMFLLTIGFSLYANGHKNIAAFLFVLAIAIKLQPIVVIIPLIAWRDWKCLRSLAIWGILLCLGLWAVNGSDALNLYFLHHLPAMSGGELGGSGAIGNNRSLGNIFFTYLSGTHPVVSSRTIGWLYKVVSALILCYAGWLSRFKQGENSTYLRQFEIGMMFLLFMCCLSPYSWLYNWALSAPVVVMFCKRAWDGRQDIVETVLLIAFLLSLSTSKFNMPMVTPILGVTLGIVALYRMRLERRPAESNNPINQLKTVSAS